MNRTVLYLKNLWRQKKGWFIVLLSQILLNIVGMQLSEDIQVGLMASSGLLLLVLSGYAVYSQRNNMLAVLLNIMLLYFNYSVVSAVYWNANSLDSIFVNSGYSREEFLNAINIELLFYGTYALLLDSDTRPDKTIFLLKEKPNFLVVIPCVAYIALAPFLFYKTESFGTRGSVTALYEYAVVVLIVALRFTGRDLRALIPLLTASIWLIFHGLISGERVLALQMMIVWGLYLLLHVLTFKLIVSIFVLGVFGFTVFGVYRGLSAMEGDVLGNTLEYLSSVGMANDTSYYAYWAGMSINRLADASTVWERLRYFMQYVLYCFGGSAVPDSNLSVIAAQLNYHAGGGWLPFYINCWLGFAGVILSGAGMAWIINRVTQFLSDRFYTNYLALYIIATCPRWYLYSPATITRGVLIFTVFYLGCCLVNKWGYVVINGVKSQFLKNKDNN